MRHIIELHVINRSNEGNYETGYRTHVITLANQEATERVVEAIKEGVIPWEVVVEVSDVLMYEDKLDTP